MLFISLLLPPRVFNKVLGYLEIYWGGGHQTLQVIHSFAIMKGSMLRGEILIIGIIESDEDLILQIIIDRLNGSSSFLGHVIVAFEEFRRIFQIWPRVKDEFFHFYLP